MYSWGYSGLFDENEIGMENFTGNLNVKVDSARAMIS
jgi:CTP-dependent riboflavin kinase